MSSEQQQAEAEKANFLRAIDEAIADEGIRADPLYALLGQARLQVEQYVAPSLTGNRLRAILAAMAHYGRMLSVDVGQGLTAAVKAKLSELGEPESIGTQINLPSPTHRVTAQKPTVVAQNNGQ